MDGFHKIYIIEHLKQGQDSVVLLQHMNPQDKIESVTKRIHEEHIAGKGQNSVVHYSLANNLSLEKDQK